MIMSVIDEFMEQYSREFTYYEKAAALCAVQCEKGLSRRGLRAIVTHRAKRHDRLREKIVRRARTKIYTTPDDIRSDIVDFSGVRIALYFPGDQTEVDQFVKEQFVVDEQKDFPSETARESG